MTTIHITHQDSCQLGPATLVLHTTVPLWPLQVEMTLRVHWGYSAVTALHASSCGRSCNRYSLYLHSYYNCNCTFSKKGSYLCEFLNQSKVCRSSAFHTPTHPLTSILHYNETFVVGKRNLIVYIFIGWVKNNSVWQGRETCQQQNEFSKKTSPGCLIRSSSKVIDTLIHHILNII